MRLPMLERGQGLFQRTLFRVIKRFGGGMPGPVAVMSYRQPFFGKYFARLLQVSMREGRHWSMGEVELFAAFVSNENRCVY